MKPASASAALWERHRFPSTLPLRSNACSRFGDRSERKALCAEMSMAKKKSRPAPVKKKKTPGKPAGKRAKNRKPPRPVVAARSPALAIRQAIDASGGVLRLAPNWVPRPLLSPGRRLKLDARDLYALGAQRGGISERWIASTTPTANPGAPSEEGLSYVALKGERLCTLADAVGVEGE